MGKVSAEARERYLEKVNQYNKQIEDISKREEMILRSVSSESAGAEYKKIRLADENLNLASYYLLMNNLSVALLGVKNEAFLNNARKVIYKVLIYLEQVLSDYIDQPFSEYAERVQAVDAYDPLSRYRLCNKIGFTIQRVAEGFGDNSKWKWSFVELEGRLAVISKNFLNQKTLFSELDPDKEFYEIKFNHLNLARRLLEQAAARYREKYEISSFQTEDFKMAIRLLEGLRKLLINLNRHNDADTIKRKIDSWQQKLDYDHKKKEMEKKGRG